MELINWPDATHWDDSGEGGLFVMMLVIKPEGWQFNCSVDVDISLPRPDVCISDVRRKLWEAYEYDTSGFRNMSDALKVFTEQKRPDLYRWAARARSSEDDSVELLMAMHIGSTPCSLHSEVTGGYFDATYDDLTVAGKGLHDMVKLAYGIEPTLVTFLDT